MKLIAMKCPACNANLTVEEGREYCFCQYCGSKILLVNENEHVYVYRRVDEAEIKRVEAERVIREKELHLEEQKLLEKRRKEKADFKEGLIYLFLGIGVLFLLMFMTRFL